MAFRVNNADVKWLVGEEVDEARSAIREVDTHFTMRILSELFSEGGALFGIGQLAQAICEQTRAWLSGQEPAVSLKLSNNYEILKAFKKDNHLGQEFKRSGDMLKGLAKVNIYSGKILINPLAIGDFTRYFADFFNALPNNADTAAKAIRDFLKSLQNPIAFNKSTNRVRVNRRNVFDQGPGVGLAHWYLPPDDVLGAIDRFLGYYETADISGSTTDSIAILALLQTITPAIIDQQTTEIKTGSIPDIRGKFVAMVNNGLAFGAFASIVAQMHHSLPESMMAINIIPDAALTPNTGDVVVNKSYSPYLSNSDFENVSATYKDWWTARNAVLRQTGRVQDEIYYLFVLQDVYQMPNKATINNEVGVIVGFQADAQARLTNDNLDTIFGALTYNAFVSGLNNPGPGPAPTLQRLSNKILPGAEATAPLFSNTFNPELPADGPSKAKIIKAVEDGMGLPENKLAGANNYNDLVRPFLGVAEYGQISPVTV